MNETSNQGQSGETLRSDWLEHVRQSEMYNTVKILSAHSVFQAPLMNEIAE